MGAARHRGHHRKARVASQPQAAVRDAGHYLEHRVGRQPGWSRNGGTAVGSLRPGVTAAVALAAASVIAITPVAPPPPLFENHVTSAEVRLAASSIWNIPINLVQDIINIPYNEVQGINTLGQSLLFSGTWLLASSTNVWGTDPGDPGHYYGLANLFPFPAFSNSLAAQISGLAAVLLPINSGCNNVDCPNVNALYAGYFQPDRILALLTTGKWTFAASPVTDPDGTVHPPEGLWNFGGPVTWGAQYGHPEWNTVTDPATGQPVVPWAGTTFTSNPFAPVSDYLTHLMSDPTSPENTIKFPTLQQIATAFVTLVKSVFVAFSPFFPGSPYCLGLCGTTYGAGSVLAPPFYYDPAPAAPPPGFELFNTAPTTASVNQNPASDGKNADSQDGAAEQNEADQQNGGAQQDEADQKMVVNLSTEAPQHEPIPPAATGAPADAAALPNDADSETGQTPDSTTKPVEKPVLMDMTRDGNMAVPDKVRGNDTNSHGRLSGVLRSVGDQIRSNISNITGGLTAGTKAGKTSTDGATAGESHIGGESDIGGS
jgi:hypothetical protein